MKQYISNSVAETKTIASRLAKETKNHIFAITGDLGAGKTIFSQGFAKGLGITEKIISPTFVLIRQHKIPRSPKTFYHIDLYRLDQIETIDQLGLEEIWSDPNNIVLIEWAEKLKELPKDSVKINITKNDHQNRIITIEPTLLE